MATLQVIDFRPNWITLGAFQKRLGTFRTFAIDTSTDPLCIALRSWLGRLDYIDLNDSDLPTMLTMLKNSSLPTAVGGWPDSGPVTDDVIARVMDKNISEIERP